MAEIVRMQRGIWLARCLCLALVWGLFITPFASAFAQEGACADECPCEVERAADGEPLGAASEAVGAADHDADCPADCLGCSCTSVIAGLPQHHQQLTLVLRCREVIDCARFEDRTSGVRVDVFRPPRHAG